MKKIIFLTLVTYLISNLSFAQDNPSTDEQMNQVLTQVSETLEEVKPVNNWELSLETLYWNYEETTSSTGKRFMKDVGRLNGLNINYIGNENWIFGLSYLSGKADYDGAYQDGTPVTIKDTSQQIVELSALYDYPIFANDLSKFSAQTGIISRTHTNKEDKSVKGDYDRKISQIIFPIGINYLKAFSDKISVTLAFSYQVLLGGNVQSDLADVGDPYVGKISNTQNKGQGFILSTRFSYYTRKNSYFVSTYIREWDVDNSDQDDATIYGDFGSGEGYYKVSGFFEPKNKTRMGGVNLGMTF